MPDNFLVFQRFSDPGLADEMAGLLREKGFECLIEKDSRFFDPSFTNNDFDPTISLKLKGQDFVSAHEALEQYYEKENIAVDETYYLNEFSDDELMNIIKQPDEWGAFDYFLAKKILQQRGRKITETDTALWRQRRTELLAQPERQSSFWIYIGYVLAIAGAFFGLVIGWMLVTSKKTIPDGRRVFSYNEQDRKHGRRIMWISGTLFLLWLVLRIVRMYNNQAGEIFTLPVYLF